DRGSRGILLRVPRSTRPSALARMSLGGLVAAAFMLAAAPASPQSASCLETGLGLYRGWHSLAYNERVRRCVDAEQRAYERMEWLREREALRLRQKAVSEYEWQRWGGQ